MKTRLKFAFAAQRTVRFSLLFVLTMLLGTTIFASCMIGTPAGVSPSLGIGLDQEMRVVFVETGGAADLGGVKTGDILKKLNDRDLTTPEQARDVFHRADTTKLLTLVLLRDGDEMTIQVQPEPIKGVPSAITPTATPGPPDMTFF